MASSSLLPFASEGICYPTSYGITCNSIKFPIDGRRVHDLTSTRCKSPFFGSSRFFWQSTGHDFVSKIGVAADYSDSIPDSSSYMGKQGYHPLEELKVSNDLPPARLSSAEIARTTIEANKNALLVFPGSVHSEPHEQISWAEFQYLIDDFGDLYFEIFDDVNLLEDRGAHNPVNALIGMDIPMYDNRRPISEYDIFNGGITDEFPFDEDYIEVPEIEESNAPVNWGLSDNSNPVHPIYFSKCLEKAVNVEYDKRMDHPSNGVSILGYLRPAYADEESYIRMIYHTEDDDGYSSDWKDFYSNSINDQRDANLILYKLEIEKIKLHCVYGSQSEISLLEFQDAEPDIIVYSTSAILERINRNGHDALQAFCKKKGLDAEEAHLIGVDHLGVDVRVLSGSEVKTHRFAFKVQANSGYMAEKQIVQLLYPRSRRKRNMQQSLRNPKPPA
ncbi:putative FMN-binding split barrel [Medicago truncatula]|uniref:PPR superfamily protein n=1 Tax=Medicago truncatula TaxID=3880 RepID=G7KCZ0_MEDTR|nr:uncharacterized protein At3g49140 [Medicago truncatula]AET00265.1 PPR superfamily protein [Medicago truncatula]RHN57600.1 putative FMN-binding split barrel [Medicago truncatula]